MNEKPKYMVLVLILLALTIYSIYDLNNVVGNELYIFLIILLMIISILIFVKICKKFSFHDKWKNIIAVICFTLYSYNIIALPISNLFLRMLINQNKIIILNGRITTIDSFDRSSIRFIGTFTGYNVTFLFEDGNTKSWKVRNPNGVYYSDKLYYSDYEIISNYKSYDNVKIIAYESPLGLELKHFKVE